MRTVANTKSGDTEIFNKPFVFDQQINYIMNPPYVLQPGERLARDLRLGHRDAGGYLRRMPEPVTQGEPPQLAQIPWGDYTVPALEGVHGTIAFEGPLGRVYTIIAGSKIRLAPSAHEIDASMRSEIPGELLRLLTGESNLITALLQNRAECNGDLMLLAQVAGSMPELGRKYAAAVAAQSGAR